MHSYVGIRADEAADRKGMVTRNPLWKLVFLFIEDGLALKDIERLLTDSGLGLPLLFMEEAVIAILFLSIKEGMVGFMETSS